MTRAAGRPDHDPPAGDPPAGMDPLAELDPAHLGPEAVARYLRRHGLAARKRLSQNHLVDGEALEAIIHAAEAGPGRPVLEVGPRIGILTAALLRTGAMVTAVELDERLYAHLTTRFAGIDRLRLVEGDFLDQDTRRPGDGRLGPGREPAVPRHQPGAPSGAGP
ncbi:MAG: rRNA adenine N-6-methyltransferase family protein [Chloroflexota bacterium]